MDLFTGCCIDLLVLDAITCFLVELMKADLLAVRRCGKQRDWAGDQGKLQIPLPIRARRHNRNSTDNMRLSTRQQSVAFPTIEPSTPFTFRSPLCAGTECNCVSDCGAGEKHRSDCVVAVQYNPRFRRAAGP